MNTILEISNWDQLVKARSEGYNNLRITVTEYNSDKLRGTKVSVVDYNTNDIYFSSFVTDLESTLIPETAKLSNDDLLEAINNFGFNVRISEPIVLSENVITILKGLYASGYRYVYRDYIPCLPFGANETGIFVSVQIENTYKNPNISKMPNFVDDEWEWCKAFTTYPIQDLIDTGTVNNGIPIYG